MNGKTLLNSKIKNRQQIRIKKNYYKECSGKMKGGTPLILLPAVGSIRRKLLKTPNDLFEIKLILQ